MQRHSPPNQTAEAIMRDDLENDTGHNRGMIIGGAIVAVIIVLGL